jgi:hypothetical protein
MSTRASTEGRGEQQAAHAAAAPFGPTAPPTASGDGSGAAEEDVEEQKQRMLTTYVKCARPACLRTCFLLLLVAQTTCTEPHNDPHVVRGA